MVTGWWVNIGLTLGDTNSMESLSHRSIVASRFDPYPLDVKLLGPDTAAAVVKLYVWFWCDLIMSPLPTSACLQLSGRRTLNLEWVSMCWMSLAVRRNRRERCTGWIKEPRAEDGGFLEWGYPKMDGLWMVYRAESRYNGWFGDTTPLFQETSRLWYDRGSGTVVVLLEVYALAFATMPTQSIFG